MKCVLVFQSNCESVSPYLHFIMIKFQLTRKSITSLNVNGCRTKDLKYIK